MRWQGSVRGIRVCTLAACERTLDTRAVSRQRDTVINLFHGSMLWNHWRTDAVRLATYRTRKIRRWQLPVRVGISALVDVGAIGCSWSDEVFER